MKKLIYIIAMLGIALPCLAQRAYLGDAKIRLESGWKALGLPAQEYYSAHEATIDIGSAYSFHDFGNINLTDGHFAIEMNYWTTKNFATGTELGLDHTAVLETFRYPLEFGGVWNRFAPFVRAGLETDFYDGTKATEVGGGIIFAGTQAIRIRGDITQFFRTNQKNDSLVGLRLEVVF